MQVCEMLQNVLELSPGCVICLLQHFCSVLSDLGLKAETSVVQLAALGVLSGLQAQ